MTQRRGMRLTVGILILMTGLERVLLRNDNEKTHNAYVWPSGYIMYRSAWGYDERVAMGSKYYYHRGHRNCLLILFHDRVDYPRGMCS